MRRMRTAPIAAVVMTTIITSIPTTCSMSPRPVAPAATIMLTPMATIMTMTITVPLTATITPTITTMLTGMRHGPGMTTEARQTVPWRPASRPAA